MVLKLDVVMETNTLERVKSTLSIQSIDHYCLLSEKEYILVLLF